jgi:hypothetical protein
MRKRFGTLLLSLLVVAALAIAYFPLTKRSTDPAIVSWEEAIAVLHAGEVALIVQTHHLGVALWLKNGTVLTTKEPSIDAIFHEIQKCGEPCKNVQTATE